MAANGLEPLTLVDGLVLGRVFDLSRVAIGLEDVGFEELVTGLFAVVVAEG